MSFPNVGLFFIIVQFMVTALVNLLLFSWFDRHRDIADKRESFVTLVGEKTTRIFIWILFVFNAALMAGTLMFSLEWTISVAVIFLMNASLFLLFIYPDGFEIDDRYRLLGDGIFFLPLLYFLM
jgi:4-hydroxybenzoate polyprenyltransferase